MDSIKTCFIGGDSFSNRQRSQVVKNILFLDVVEESIGDKLTPGDELTSDSRYHQKCQDGASTVHLYFSSTVGEEGDAAFSIMGLMVTSEH
jgi:hypothetical protein